MGAFVKYIIPLLILAFGAMAFQNCGRTLQSNGDPYEDHTINSDHDFLDTPDEGVDTPLPQGFISETSYAPKLRTGKILIDAVKLGTLNGKDSVYVRLSDGRFKVYSWPQGVSPLVLNDAITNTLTIISIQLSTDGKQIAIQMQTASTSTQEVLYSP